jgi:hypothetical protein
MGEQHPDPFAISARLLEGGRVISITKQGNR